jgi:uncharacterized membrane protein YbaN (DUF454 family)
MNIIKLVIVIIGFICVGIGTIGIFLPILPTTPFYILATICFAKGFSKFNNWFKNTKFYKKHFQNFANTRSMTINTKLSILIPVSLMVILAIAIVKEDLIRIILVILLIIKYWYFIFRIKTIKLCNKKV